MVCLQLALPLEGTPPNLDVRAARRPRLIAPPPPKAWPAILAAPVFAPDRRPGPGVAEGGVGGAVESGSLNGYAALGAVAGGGVAAGVVKSPDGAVKTLRRGETIEGWRLAAVFADRLVFEHDGARRVLAVGAPAQATAGAALIQ